MELANVQFPRIGFSFAETEVLTGVSRSTLYRREASGELKTVKFGRRRLVLAEEITRLSGSKGSSR
jgi:excisionase family DNA binding protein